MWGELAYHERLFNPPPQFSRLGTWCPNFFCMYFVVSCMYLDGGMGGGLLLILGLVRYKHTIHVHLQLLDLQFGQLLIYTLKYFSLQ